MKGILSCAIAVLFAAHAAAEIIEVPLDAPEAIGVWSAPAVFDIDASFNPYHVVDVRVRLAGASCGGWYHCGIEPYNWNYYRDYATLQVSLGQDVLTEAVATAARNIPACEDDPLPFDEEISLPAPAEGWASLWEQGAQLLLEAPDHDFWSPVDYTKCYLADAFYGLETLVVVIETDSTVPNENASWSTLKTRYR